MTVGSTRRPSAAAEPAADLVGTGCAGYAEQVPAGPGSVTGMAQDPVAMAASNNPMLTTLTAALSGKLNPKVNLVDTLNGGRVHRVRARPMTRSRRSTRRPSRSSRPTRDLLTSILTYHVVPGQAEPRAGRRRRTRRSRGDVTVTGAGNDLKVNDAGLVCGGVHDRQRDGLHDRHGADAAGKLTHS